MILDTSESSFEDSIVDSLTQAEEYTSDTGWGAVAEEAPAYPGFTLGGYQKRNPSDYSLEYDLIPDDLFDFLIATQPEEWRKLKKIHESDTKTQFAKRIRRELKRKGTLHVMRNGIKDRGCKFQLAYFQPSTSRNPTLQKKYQANIFSVIRQLKLKDGSKPDLVLFLNGLPIFTAEIKNPVTGQTFEDAIHQYKEDRSPNVPLFSFRRCLAHFALDTEEVHFATKLEKDKTTFFPFNRGFNKGKGNPPAADGIKTKYLWESIWSKESILDLIQNFIHEFVEEDNGKKEKKLIFPRYHQLRAIRRLLAAAQRDGPGHRYLIQHSAGSGKTFTMSWLAHQLTSLFDKQDDRIFDSIILITDRRNLDRQLQEHVKQFEQTPGLVKPIDMDSSQLARALKRGKQIIVTTQQKFPFIVEEISELPATNFALIIDEAHSAQTGETRRQINEVLATGNLDEATKLDEEGLGEDLEDKIVAEMKKRGRLSNVSSFAFTATPKPKTREMFGTRTEEGMVEPFSLYSMRQAIEEGFILDVLENYTTYRHYYHLIKTIEEDPEFEKSKTQQLITSYVSRHEHTIKQKVAIIAEHFHEQVSHRIKGKAKAMIVTQSRLHAVRYKRKLDEYLKSQGYPYKALIAFSGTVKNGGIDYTEANMNGFPQSQTRDKFEEKQNRFLVVANKFQTGFDQPLLHTMYVDKKLGGVNAVQTLSRLNRTHKHKKEAMVLDFVNTADDIQDAFKPYYEKAILKEGTDPNLLYDLEGRLKEFVFYSDEDIKSFANIYWGEEGSMDQLHGVVDPVVSHYLEASEDEQGEFRRVLGQYVRMYSYLSLIVNFHDPDLEMLYQFGRFLLGKLPTSDRSRLPQEVINLIDINSSRVQKVRSKKIPLGGEKTNEGPPFRDKGSKGFERIEEKDPLSKIIKEINERFGAEFTEDDKVVLERVEEKIKKNDSLRKRVQTNPPENARLAFDEYVKEKLQELVESNMKLYKKINDNEDVQKSLLAQLFKRFRQSLEK